MDAELTQLAQQETELTAQLQGNLTEYGRMVTAQNLVLVLKKLNRIYKQQLANIKENGSINN